MHKLPATYQAVHTGTSHWLLYAALLALTLLAFEPLRHNGFVKYDDDTYLTANFKVQLGLTRESIHWAFTTGRGANWHPITWLSHMLDYQLFGLNPLGHHLTSLCLHIANTLLLFWLLKKTTRTVWPGAFVAAAFAIHPMHVESVAWLAERKDVLSGLFWMLTIAAYIRYRRRPGPAWYIVVLALFALGLMAKPMLVTLPFVLLLLDYWPLGETQPPRTAKAPSAQSTPATSHLKPSWSRLILQKTPLFIMAAVSSIGTFTVQRTSGAMDFSTYTSFSSRIANALVSYAGYIGKIISPVRLAVLYPYSYRIALSKIALSLLLLAAISAVVLVLNTRCRYLLTGWLWYLGTLVPVIGLVQVGAQATADRYTYLPSIGLFIMAAWGTAQLATQRYRKVLLMASAAMVLGVWLLLTRTQVRVWRDGLTLFGQAVSVTENNFIMHRLFGDELLRRKRLDEAIEHYQKAIALAPRYCSARASLAQALSEKGRFAEAVGQLNEALRLKPTWEEAYNCLGVVYFQQGDIEQAITAWKKALQIKPDFMDVTNNLAWVRATWPEPDIRNPQEAVQMALDVCRPTSYKNPQYLDTLAAAYAACGSFDAAVEAVTKAISLAIAAGEKDFADQIEPRLKLYQLKKPYVEAKYPRPPQAGTFPRTN